MKTLGATKELVVEAAFHSTTIEIDAKSQDKIRMTKYWKQFVAKNESNKKKSSSSIKKKSSSSSSSSKAKEKELDNAEVNEQTIDAIVAGIEKKKCVNPWSVLETRISAPRQLLVMSVWVVILTRPSI